ncbi:ion channel protein [Maribacter sp. 4U21]|uniref:tetratricopeptide repeat protein n=1 Tax=Maribacter sp. 4U21 TaxID=1889779 RepID=UPI000C160396|nr:tetratricopeptide repeat protein [Maribacter sp. 4U21]PIB31370.1 ion channel protein [Maribacter sp. 4U21]
MKRFCNILVLLFGFLVFAQEETLFDNATAAYNEGDYEKAIGFYNTILEDGQHSASLYFNLGNSYYKLNDIAQSIYYYEKALLLAPEDKEIMNNLGYAQQMTLDAIDTMPETGLSRFYKTITAQLSFDQWAKLGVGLMILFVILYIVFYYAQYASRKRWAFIGSLVSLFLTILSIVFAFVQYSDFQKQQPAIVFADEIGIQSEPNTGSDEIFVLHAGTKVNIIEKLNDWKRIRLADGKTGWVPSQHIKVLKDF